MNKMLRNIFITLFKRDKSTQDKLTEFVFDVDTISRAAKGSMKKRNELINRVQLNHSK